MAEGKQRDEIMLDICYLHYGIAVLQWLLNFLLCSCLMISVQMTDTSHVSCQSAIDQQFPYIIKASGIFPLVRGLQKLMLLIRFITFYVLNVFNYIA